MKRQRNYLFRRGTGRSATGIFQKNSISLIFFLLDQLADKINFALVNGFFGKFFTSYSSAQNLWDQGISNRFLMGNQRIRKVFRSIRQYLSRSFEESGFVKFFQRVGQRFLSVPMKTFGNFFLFFGVYSISICLLRWIFSPAVKLDFYAILIGFFSCFIGFAMFRSRDSIAQAVGHGKISKFIFVHLFGFRKETMQTEPIRSKTLSNVMIILGMALGLSTVLIPAKTILIGIFLLIGVSLLLAMPEIGVLLSVFMLPFFYWFESPSITLGMLILATAISYLIKIFRGKRLFKFELIDFAILLFFAVMFFSGVHTAGGQSGFHEVLLSCVLIFGYFMTVNLLRTEHLLDRCAFALMLSGTVTSVLGIIQYVTKKFHTGAWLDASFHSDIEGRADALFENPNILAAFLVLTLPFALSFLVQAKETKERLVCLFATLSILACIVLTWSRGAWIAALIELLLFAIVYSKKTFRYVILACVAIPFLSFLLPKSITKRFVSIGNLADSSIMYRVYTWKGSWNLAKEYLWGGIGYGSQAYREMYPMFAYAGIEAAEHCHNLFLQILIGLGLGGLLIFIAVLLLFFQMNLEHLKISKNHRYRMMILASICAIVAHLVMGIFDFTWFSYRIFFLFWVIIGLACAYTRMGQEDLRRSECKGDADLNSATLEFNV